MVCERLGLEPMRRPGKKNGGGNGGVVGGAIRGRKWLVRWWRPLDLEELCWRKRGRRNWRAENVSGEVAIGVVWAKGIVVPRALMQGVMGLPRYHRHRPANDGAEEPLRHPAPAAVAVAAG